MLLTIILLLLLLTSNLLLNTLKINFHDFLPAIIINSFFSLNPTDKIKVENIIMSLNPSKAVAPNIIPITFSIY